jgi:predicted DNA-binding transcriptional regulator YafY
MAQTRSTWKKTDRMQAVLEALEAKPRTVEDLCSRLNLEHSPANHRAILRDIDDLRSREHSIEQSEHKQPIYTWQSSPPKPLQPNEALAAHVALRMLYHHTPNPPKSYRHALEKIAISMPQEMRQIAGHASLLEPTTRNHPDEFEKIADCWLQRRVMRFEHQKSGGSGENRIVELETYFVEASRSNFELYVIGRRRNWKPEVRTYTMRLIKRVTPLNDTYTIPEDFDPKRFLSNAWGVIGDQHPIIVRVKFPASVLPWLEGRHFPGVINKEINADGSQTFTIQTGADSEGMPRELIPWIRGWGANIEVLEPQILRDRWLSDARDLINRHGGS